MSMESSKVLCEHGEPCSLKTGLKPGPMFHKTVYICGRNSGKCSFAQVSKLKPLMCRTHSEVVSLQVWHQNRKDINYFCSKHEGGKFCGMIRHSRGKSNKENKPLPSKCRKPQSTGKTCEDPTHDKSSSDRSDSSSVCLSETKLSSPDNPPPMATSTPAILVTGESRSDSDPPSTSMASIASTSSGGYPPSLEFGASVVSSNSDVSPSFIRSALNSRTSVDCSSPVNSELVLSSDGQSVYLRSEGSVASVSSSGDPNVSSTSATSGASAASVTSVGEVFVSPVREMEAGTVDDMEEVLSSQSVLSKSEVSAASMLSPEEQNMSSTSVASGASAASVTSVDEVVRHMSYLNMSSTSDAGVASVTSSVEEVVTESPVAGADDMWSSESRNVLQISEASAVLSTEEVVTESPVAGADDMWSPESRNVLQISEASVALSTEEGVTESSVRGVEDVTGVYDVQEVSSPGSEASVYVTPSVNKVVSMNTVSPVDRAGEEPVRSVDLVKEDSVKHVDLVDEEPVKHVDLVEEEPVRHVDLVEEEPVRSVDLVKEDSVKHVDLVDEEPVKHVDLVEEEPVRHVDLVEEEPVRSVDLVEEEPVRSVDLVEEEPVRHVDLVEEEPVRHVDLVREDIQQFKVGYQSKTVMRQFMEIQHILQTRAAYLPDGGAQLRAQLGQLKQRLQHLKKAPPKVLDHSQVVQLSQRNLVTQSKQLTTGAIVQLHSSLETCPKEDDVVEDPPGLSVPLMKHQRRGLAWLLWRESQTPAAGILADEMGLGKTLTMLSLVLTKRGTQEERQKWLRKPASKTDLVKSPATLVVCPKSLMLQWKDEAESKLNRQLSVYVYHDKKITTNPYELVHYDLVVTTYDTVGAEGSSCVSDEPEPEVSKKKSKRTVRHTTLFQIHWRRVILDEAHYIKNPSTAMSIGACKLSADYRWAVTGTPIQNRLKDFYSLIKFIHLAPFDDARVWKDMVDKKGSLGMQRVNTIVSSLVLRRTKEELGLGLAKKFVTRHDITLNEGEMAIHHHIFTVARKVMYSWLQERGEDVKVNPHEEPDSGPTHTLTPDVEPVVAHLMRGVNSRSATGNYVCVLLLLTRLRQCCCHMKLLVNGLDKSSEPDDNDDVDLVSKLGALSLNAPPQEPIDLQNLPEIFKQETMSTKIVQVVGEIRKIVAIPDDPPQKCVVVSQWTKMLDIVEFHLDGIGISYTRIDGTNTPSERISRVEMLNSRSKHPSYVAPYVHKAVDYSFQTLKKLVMLLSIRAGGVGLNLIGANHVFMLDMDWNPAVEEQAADRCHRVGQTRDVFIHKFVCRGTIEERILRLQEQKLQLASNVMTGASQKNRSNRNKPSLAELKSLFDLA